MFWVVVARKYPNPLEIKKIQMKNSCNSEQKNLRKVRRPIIKIRLRLLHIDSSILGIPYNDSINYLTEPPALPSNSILRDLSALLAFVGEEFRKRGRDFWSWLR